MESNRCRRSSAPTARSRLRRNTTCPPLTRGTSSPPSTATAPSSQAPTGGGYWSKQGPELLEHRAALFAPEQRLVFGATTFRQTVAIMTSGVDPNTLDEWNVRAMGLPTTVVSSTLGDTLGWLDATIVSGDAVDVVSRLKEESPVPLRSLGSLSLNWALLAAGLIDRVQVTVFPVLTGRTGTSPIFGGAGDVDLELLESRTFDGRSQGLVYRPTPR